jgi:transcriptional regulator GlxA family with amidase domain
LSNIIWAANRLAAQRLSAKHVNARDTLEIGVVLVPGFSLMVFAATVEPLRGANLIEGRKLYRWSLISPEGGAIMSGAGVEVATSPLPQISDTEIGMLVICGGMGTETYEDRKLTTFLRQLSRRNVIIGAVSTAPFILASAGLLDSRRCTVHWDARNVFKERFPHLNLSNDLFVIDNGVFTCAGGIGVLDVMLHFIRQRQGDRFAAFVSDLFIHGAIRQPKDAQRMALRNRLGVVQPTVVKAIEIMEHAVESPITTTHIAKKVGVSTRQLERLFHHHLGCSPIHYYVGVRLEAARRLIRQSTMPVLEIGIACGFTSASHFARIYRRHFGVTPSVDREPALESFDRVSLLASDQRKRRTAENAQPPSIKNQSTLSHLTDKHNRMVRG